MNDRTVNPYQAPEEVPTSITDPDGRLDRRLIRVAQGLRLFQYAITMVLTSVIATYAGTMLVSVPLWTPFFAATSILGLLGCLVGGLGPFLLLGVPEQTGLRALAVAMVIVGIMTITALVVAIAAISLAPIPRISMLVMMMIGIAMLLWFSFRLSRHVGRPDLARRTRGIGIVGVIAVAGLLLSLLLLPRFNAGPVPFASFGILTLLVFAAIANLLRSLRIAIGRGIHDP